MIVPIGTYMYFTIRFIEMCIVVIKYIYRSNFHRIHCANMQLVYRSLKYIIVLLEVFYDRYLKSTFMQHSFSIPSNLPQTNKTSFRRRSSFCKNYDLKNFFLCSSFVGYNLVKNISSTKYMLQTAF